MGEQISVPIKGIRIGILYSQQIGRDADKVTLPTMWLWWGHQLPIRGTVIVHEENREYFRKFAAAQPRIDGETETNFHKPPYRLKLVGIIENDPYKWPEKEPPEYVEGEYGVDLVYQAVRCFGKVEIVWSIPDVHHDWDKKPETGIVAGEWFRNAFTRKPPLIELKKITRRDYLNLIKGVKSDA